MDEKSIRKIASLISEDADIFEGKPVIAPPAAPPKPGTTPSKPKERPKFKPFNPPRPAKQPQPKASILIEDFRTSAHPSTVDFWQNIRGSEHPYGKHPLMAMYGYESADKSFMQSMEKLREVFPELRNMPPQQATQMAPQFAMQALQAMMRLERPHARQLEQLAVKAVSEAWNVPPEILRAMLTSNPQPDMQEEEDDSDEVQDVDLPQFDKETLRPQINKRITMNAMTQGAAVHNMATIHHIVKDDLDEIEPRLLQLYQRFASGSTHFYWIIDFVNLTKLALKGAAVGWSGVQYDENDEPVVVAKAVNFPVLVQELVKGVMELLSHHGLEGLSPGELDVVYGEADRLEDEPWLIQIGPQIWRTFLSIVPKGHDLVTIVAQLARQEPDYIHKVLSQAIEAVHRGADPTEAKQAMMELMDQLEEHTGEDLFDADDYSEFKDDYDDDYDEYGY